MRSQPHKRAPAHRDRRSLTDYQLPRRRVGEREQRGSRPTWETRPSLGRAASSLGLLRPPRPRPLGGACRGRGENLQPRPAEEGTLDRKEPPPASAGRNVGGAGQALRSCGGAEAKSRTAGAAAQTSPHCGEPVPCLGSLPPHLLSQAAARPGRRPCTAGLARPEAGHGQNQARQTGPGSVAARTMA